MTLFIPIWLLVVLCLPTALLLVGAGFAIWFTISFIKAFGGGLY